VVRTTTTASASEVVRRATALFDSRAPSALGRSAADPGDAVAGAIMAGFDHLDELVVAMARPLGLGDDTDTKPSEDVDRVTSRLARRS